MYLKNQNIFMSYTGSFFFFVDFIFIYSHHVVTNRLYSCPRECCSLKNQLSQKEMILHTLNDCPLRLIQCIYCPLRIPKMDVGAHQNICGSREATCLSCKAKHKRKEIGRHVHKIHGKNKVMCVQDLRLMFVLCVCRKSIAQ